MATQENQDNFLRILLDVCEKTMQNAMIQNARMQQLWKRHLERFEVTFHPIPSMKFEKQAFLDSIPARIPVLENCEAVMVDTYWAIKQVAIALFQGIPPGLPAHYPEFKDPSHVETFILRISEKFINALMAFFALEHDIVAPRTFIFGKISTYLRLKKRISVEEIATMMEKDGVMFTANEIAEAMDYFQTLGLIKQDESHGTFYLHVKKLELPPEQEKIIKQEFFPIVEWAIETWRTIFNIRELNTPIPDHYTNKILLEHVVSYAATQGFTTAHFCFHEIKKYHEFLVECSNTKE